MSLVTPYINRLEKIKTSIPRVATRAIIENAEMIIQVLKDKQLSEGLDYMGKNVYADDKYNGFYKTSTQNIAEDPQRKPRKPKIAGTAYNFEWTGDFFDSLNLRVNAQKKTFEIYSTTNRDVYLETFYKTDLTTLMKGNEQFVMDAFVKPFLIDYINSEMAKL